MRPAPVTSPSKRRGAWRLRCVATATIDLLIAAYAIALLVLLVTGGIDLGVLTLNNGAKPTLMVILLVPLRLAVADSSCAWEFLRPCGIRAFGRAHAWIRQSPPAVVDVLFALVATRVATFFIGFVANLLFTPSRSRGFSMPFVNERFAEIFAAWDSGWYYDIAARGYFFAVDGQSSVTFFPLYPLLMRAVAWPFGGTDRAIWMAGIGISCTAFTFALIALHRLTERVFGDREIARRTVLYLAVFPFSLFFTRVYAESLFLLTSVLAVSRAAEGQWWRAGIWGALATLTRPNGILIGVPLVLFACNALPSPWRLLRATAPLLLLPAALAGYSAYVYSLSGDPLGWLSAQLHWGYSLGHPPWQQLLRMVSRFFEHGPYGYFFASPMAPFRLFHGATAILFLVLLPAIFKRLGVAMGMYVLVSLLVPLTSNALEGVGRYAAVLFPAFMLMGSWVSPRAHEAILVCASLFLALFVTLFVTVRPIY